MIRENRQRTKKTWFILYMTKIFCVLILLLTICTADYVSETVDLDPGDVYAVKIPGRNPLKAVAWGTNTIELFIMPDNCITLEDGKERYNISMFKLIFGGKTVPQYFYFKAYSKFLKFTRKIRRQLV